MGKFKISEIDRIVLSKYLENNPNKTLEILAEMIYQSDETKLSRNTIVTYLSIIRNSNKPKEKKQLFENEFESGITINDINPEKEIFNDVSPTQYQKWKKILKKKILELDVFEPNREKSAENFGRIQGMKDAIEIFESIKIE